MSATGTMSTRGTVPQPYSSLRDTQGTGFEVRLSCMCNLHIYTKYLNSPGLSFLTTKRGYIEPKSSFGFSIKYYMFLYYHMENPEQTFWPPQHYSYFRELSGV